MPGNVEPRYSEFVTFIGVSVDHDTNTNYYMNATLAYKRACLNAIEYLKTFGYLGPQAYLLLGSAPIEGRISGIVDIPNACASCIRRPPSSTSTSGPPRTAPARPTGASAR